jgi:hypothetical protein
VNGSGHDGSLTSDAEAVIDGHQERSFVGSIRQKRHPLQSVDQFGKTFTIILKMMSHELFILKQRKAKYVYFLFVFVAN